MGWTLAAQLRQLHTFLEARPQARQLITPNEHAVSWALAPHGTLPLQADDMLQLPDNCIDGDLLVKSRMHNNALISHHKRNKLSTRTLPIDGYQAI